MTCLKNSATRQHSNRPAQLQKLVSLGILGYTATTGIIISRRQRRKVLIRLHRCTGYAFVVYIQHKLQHGSTLFAKNINGLNI